MVRVKVIEAVSVYPNGQFITLAAGDVVDGPLAEWLIDQSGCAITVEQDDRPASAGSKPAAASAPAGATKKAAPGTAP